MSCEKYRHRHPHKHKLPPLDSVVDSKSHGHFWMVGPADDSHEHWHWKCEPHVHLGGLNEEASGRDRKEGRP